MLTARSAEILRALWLVAVVACAGRRRADPPAEPQAANCQGRTYLEVTNTLSESIDVYIGDLSKRTFLGTASPRRTRLPVENWRGTYPTFAERNGGAAVGRAVQSTYVWGTA